MGQTEALRALLSTREFGFDGCQCVAGLGAVGAAGLRHVGTSAAAFAAQCFGADFHQLDGTVAGQSGRR